MRNLDLLIPQQEREQDRWTWATVTGINPLRIRLDGESAALDITPENLAGTLRLDERVWVQIHGRRTIVHAPAGGVSSTPAGTMSMFAGQVAPAGYLLCEGQEVAQSAYPELYAAIGSTFGAAAAGNFRLPDMRHRLPVGASGDLGASDGSSNLTARANSHSHRHNHSIPNTNSAGSHSHNASGLYTVQPPESDDRSFASGGQNGVIENHTHPVRGTTGSNGSHSHSIPNANHSDGVGGGLSAKHAYTAVNYIIKT